MNSDGLKLDLRITALALIGLRALAEYDPTEYARATDASKADLDVRIRKFLASLDHANDDRLDSEIRDKYIQLQAIAEESRGRTEFVFLLRQLHTSSLERAQQLSLRFARNPPPPEDRSANVPQRASALSRRGPEKRSPEHEFLLLAVMRLLRDLPDYVPLFEITASDRGIDCVLTSPRELPAVVIEAKLYPDARSIKGAATQARRAAAAWGKGSVAVVILPVGKTRQPSWPPGIQGVVVLEFDSESNSFFGGTDRELIARLYDR